MKLSYYRLDVFTKHRFSGNPLAVVMKADGLSPTRMQAIAAEFNLSETVFITTAASDKQAVALRIFTPRVELAFAGHPTIGAAVLIGLQQGNSAVRLELGVGLVTALLDKLEKQTGYAMFGLPVMPSRIGPSGTNAAIAAALGLGEDDIGFGAYQPAVWSAGGQFHLVPLRNAEALRAVAIGRAGWNEVFPGGRNSVYLFTATPHEPESDFAARMFSPGMGIAEDPATGSAAAALIGMLALDAAYPDGTTQLCLRQGEEMGRPSFITLQFKKQDGVLVHAAIGGHAVLIGEGGLDLSD